MPTSSYPHHHEEFRKAWRAAVQHVKSFDSGEQRWLRANLDEPLTEHFSFAVGNRLFLVLIETPEYGFGNYLKELILLAKKMEATPCVMKMMRNGQGEYIPTYARRHGVSWGLRHAETLEEISPDEPEVDESLKLSAVERHVIAVNAAVDRLIKDGNRIRDVQAYPPTWPSIRFENDLQECWAMVQSSIDPIPYEIDALLARDKIKEQDGYMAIVDITASEGMGCSTIEAEPIIRAHEYWAQVTYLEKTFDHQTGEYKYLDSLSMEIDWYERNRPEDFRGDLCQCGSDDFVFRSRSPGRMRAFLLVSIFVDQFMYTHFRENYQDFSKLYRIPKLHAHNTFGYASPSWLTRSHFGDYQHVEWDKINLFAPKAKKVAYEFIKKYSSVSENGFENILVDEIKSEFRGDEGFKLCDAFGVNINQRLL